VEDQEEALEHGLLLLTKMLVVVIIHPLPLYKVLMEEWEINIVVHQVLE
jgi:hypothetical protein